jgi:hypothetical protein
LKKLKKQQQQTNSGKKNIMLSKVSTGWGGSGGSLNKYRSRSRNNNKPEEPESSGETKYGRREQVLLFWPAIC